MCHIITGIFRIHSFFESQNSGQDGEKCIDAFLIAGSSISGNTSGKCKNRNVVCLGYSGNSDGCFSHYCLFIQPSFPGNDNISGFYIILQPGFFQYDFDSGFQSSMEKCLQCKSKTSCRTGAGIFRVCIRVSVLCKAGIG